MNVFLKITRAAAATAACVVLFSLAGSAQEERTAGTMPVAVPHGASIEQQKPVQSPVEKESSQTLMPSKQLGRANFKELESYGLLTNASDGGLGIDLWEGSERGFLLGLVQQVPAATGYRTIQDLVRRALLTRTDMKFMKNGDDAEPGNDFLTIRIEKLTDMGDFADAVKLYTTNPDKPYHERLAKAGILAMLYNGDTALGCLEEKALKDELPETKFWQQVAALCSYSMAQMGDEAESAKLGNIPFEGNAVLRKVIEKEDFRYSLQKAENFESFSPVEKAGLISEGRIDYSSLNVSELRNFSPLSSGLFARDKNVPEALRLLILALRVDRGFDTPESLAAYYKSVSFNGQEKSADPLASYAEIKGWKRLPFLYKSAEAADETKRAGIIANALILNNEYPLATLLPFAGFLDNAAPADLPSESVRTGMKLYAMAARKAPAIWLEKWASIRETPTDRLTDLAYNVATNTAEEESKTPAFTAADAVFRDKARTQLVNMIKEKLDKTLKLHKYTDLVAYEKSLDLTFGEGYVMPSVSLIDDLEKAEQDRRLGEVVLLSAIALKGVPPAKIYAGLLWKVMYGFETVGLTKEARELAMEVVLGISNEKEN